MKMPDLCPCCEALEHSYWASESGFDVVRCNECGLLYVHPMPDPTYVDRAVRTGAHNLGGLALNVRSRRVPRKVPYYRRRMAAILKDVIDCGRPVTWVDVGCGYGEFIEALRMILPPGSKIIGVEPMAHKAEAARKQGLEVINDYLKPQQFEADFISNIDVFSHIPDYRAFLNIVRSNLKSSGELIIETGNGADLQSRKDAHNELGLPDHLVFAGRTTMSRYLDSMGFEISSVSEERFDTITQMIKNLIKLSIGRTSYLGIPYTSPYRQLIFRASKR
jgi:SAM-dependent methyltransferase